MIIKTEKGIVIHIITTLCQGGAENSLLRLTTYSKKFDHIVLVLFLNRKKDLFLKKFEKNQTLVLSFLEFIKTCLKKDFLFKNIVLVQTWMYHADIVGLFLSFILKKKLIWGIRNSSLSLTKTKITTWIIFVFAIITSRIPALIISCSQKASYIHIKCGYPKNKIKIIPNACEKDRFYPDKDLINKISKINPFNEAVQFGFIARYSPQKDFNNLFSAINILKFKYKLKFNLVLAGKDIDSDNKELIQLIKKYNIYDICILKSEVMNVAEIIKSCKLTILSSKYGEAFPNVVLESITCGVPVIATNVGDASFIINNENLIVPPSQPLILAKTIFNVTTLNSRQYIKLSESLIEQSKKFCIDKFVNDYETAYFNLT